MTDTAPHLGIVLNVEVDQIKVGKRHRQDLGDLEPLIASIQTVGLLQPIVITGKNELVVGRRRLAAFEQLGRETIPARVYSDMPDAHLRLVAERDENLCRKDFTVSDAVEIGKAIEELERAKARERQRASQARKGEKVHKKDGAQGAGKFPTPSRKEKGRARAKAAEAVGMSDRTYAKAKAVEEAAQQDPEQFGDLAQQQNATGKVDPAYREMKRRKGKPTATNDPKKPLPAETEQRPSKSETVGHFSILAPGLDGVLFLVQHDAFEPEQLRLLIAQVDSLQYPAGRDLLERLLHLTEDELDILRERLDAQLKTGKSKKAPKKKPGPKAKPTPNP